MIIPKIYRSPWTSVMDVEGIRILMPFSLLNEDDFQIEPLVDYILYLSFYIRLFNLCLEKSLQNVTYKRLMTHQITATKLYNMLLPYFGLDVNMTPVGNGVFTSFIGKPPPYNKSALHDYPIQPIEYDKGDTFEILKTLSSCGKVALMDSKDNIDAITTFLNDNQQEIRYVKGHDDFFTEIKGWTLFPVRGSYAEKRLKLMISSGIFAHWELIYKLWKSKKLLNHYANRSQQAVPSGSGLDLDSKITTAFYICGLCLIICILALLVEIGTYNINHALKLYYWIHRALINFGYAAISCLNSIKLHCYECIIIIKLKCTVFKKYSKVLTRNFFSKRKFKSTKYVQNQKNRQ